MSVNGYEPAALRALQEQVNRLESRLDVFLKKEPIATITTPLIQTIKEAACRKYRISMLDLIGSVRTKGVIRPRHIAMYLSRRGTLNTLPVIARHFGNRDHTTVLHAYQKIGEERLRDSELNHELNELETELGMLRSD